MKRQIGIVVIVFTILLLSYIGYLQYRFATFIDRTIRAYTHINNYEIIQKIHNDVEWYAKININPSDGEALLKFYPFKAGYNSKVIAGMAHQGYIKSCGDCRYYLKDKNVGQYGYILFCLTKDKRQLEIYQCFGD